MNLLKEQEAVFYGLLSHVRVESNEDTETLKKLCARFIIRSMKPGEILWALDTQEPELHFVLEGAFAEYLHKDRSQHILRLYRKGKFAYSEDLVLYTMLPDTHAQCLVSGRVATVHLNALEPLMENNGIGSQLMEALINHSMTEYRNATYELLQATGTNRIQAALEQFPDLLNLIPRTDLADYLGISRASLFRSLKMIKEDARK